MLSRLGLMWTGFRFGAAAVRFSHLALPHCNIGISHEWIAEPFRLSSKISSVFACDELIDRLGALWGDKMEIRSIGNTKKGLLGQSCRDAAAELGFNRNGRGFGSLCGIFRS